MDHKIGFGRADWHDGEIIQGEIVHGHMAGIGNPERSVTIWTAFSTAVFTQKRTLIIVPSNEQDTMRPHTVVF